MKNQEYLWTHSFYLLNLLNLQIKIKILERKLFSVCISGLKYDKNIVVRKKLFSAE